MIPFVNLQNEASKIREINQAIQTVLGRSQFILGEEGEKFEKEFSDYIGTKQGIGMNSGSDALFLALNALGVGKGDEVITVAHTFVSTADAIVRNGAKPVFVDINSETYTMDVAQLEAKISNKTKAIIPVHLYGNPADMTPIMETAEKHGISVVEDACQAHGAEYKNVKTGSIGHVGCFSFYPTKNLGAYGDAGIVVTNNEELADKLRKLRNYGQSKKYYHDFVGVNSRLDELQAAILRAKLPHLEELNEKRRNIAKHYDALLKNTDVITPIGAEYTKHVYHLYVIRHKRRDILQQYLMDHGVQTMIHYPIPIHLQEAYKTPCRLPVTEKICSEILSLPMYPWLKESEVTFISELINRYCTN